MRRYRSGFGMGPGMDVVSNPYQQSPAGRKNPGRKKTPYGYVVVKLFKWAYILIATILMI